MTEHFSEYQAAHESAVLIERTDRALYRVHGRDPVRMLQGIITNDIAGAAPGRGVYAVLLTPKGKMIGELRVWRRPGGDLLFDTDAAARAGLEAHLKKFLPPLYARFELLPGVRVTGIYGPRAAELCRAVLGAVPPAQPEESFVLASFAGEEVLASATGYAGLEGYDVVAPEAAAESLRRALLEAGAHPASHDTLDVLRIEAGRPRWGAELTEDVIPLEAGLHERAISETKGCYTGQEVIVRILHRGHVNWLLRGALLGDAPLPAPGDALIRAEDGRSVGRITSACHSPRHAQTIALAYVRREIEPPATLRLRAAAGPPARVVALPFTG